MPAPGTSTELPTEGGPRRDQSSKARFIEAAALEFVETGYEKCTIRSIAARAGTSIASLSRNWTGKQHLFEDVFALHFAAINAAQNRNLDLLEREGDPGLDELLYAFYRPVLAPSAKAGGGTPSHLVYCKALSDPSEDAKLIIRKLVSDVRARMIGYAQRFLPDCSEQEVYMAMTVINGTYLYPQIHGARLAAVMGISETSIDWDKAARGLAAMVAAGLLAYRDASQ
tara:strand:+ start:387 stop:1067 length:681 start_codon:yes stop_codon:yes gene_type:complete